MQQTSYVLNKDLHFTDAGFLAKAGDVFVHTPPSQVVVYRNGDIMIQMGTTQASINGLAVSGVLSRIAAQVAAAPEAPKAEPPKVVEPEAPKADEPEASADAAPEAAGEESAPAATETTPEVETPAAPTPEAPAPEVKAEPKADAKKASKKR